MEYLEWVFRIGITLGFIWALRELRAQRTKEIDGIIADKNKPQPKAGDALMTLRELNIRCKECKVKIKEERDTEMDHVREIIETHLEHGKQKFDELGGKVERITDAMGQLTTGVTLLQETVKAAIDEKKAAPASG